MYGDIIPPKKIHHTETIEDDSIHAEMHQVNKSIHFTPIKRSAYQQPRNVKGPIFLGVLALLLIGTGVYHKIFNGTTFEIIPKTTRFEIQQKIPLILQNREKDALTYSLVYVQDENSARNPFTPAQASSTETPQLAKTSTGITITATSTGDIKTIKLINKTTETVPLRIATRFDVDGVTYTLDAATNLLPTPKGEFDTIATDTPQYKVIGFKGSSSYDTVYAISANENSSRTQANASAGTSTSNTSSSIPPQDVLSLMPEGAIALQKSTIYDKLIDQSAVVVFDEKVLEDFLNATNVELQEYFKALKPFGSSISYTITIVDYTLNTSPENGKPVSFSSLSLDITPRIENSLIPQQFAGFKKETMDKIQKQVDTFLTLKASYTPFWSKTVAEEEKINVK